jgi:acetyltransferase-like isoleucine patch superfamily enzyme/GT2 family glycosyltransferase
MNAWPPIISVVVIGRNEGERLRRCLLSLQACDWQGQPHETLYVDSQSSDGSLALARSLGAQAVLLDDPSPCAAKARNLGWRQASGKFVLFLDGDTELEPGFVARALAVLQGDARLCAVWGHRRESDPEQSVYTRVLDLDWVYPAGPSLYFGGDVLVRRAALEQAGGFDPALKAGEEPELCARLRALGWTIEHLDIPMTRHDLALRSLRGWALRAYRSGIAYAEVAARMHALGDPLWQRESRRDRWHGLLYLLLLPLLVLTLAWQPAAGLALLAASLLVLLRSAWRCRWKAPGQPLLWLQYALHSHLQKIPALAGQLAWQRAQRQRHEIGLVEYKEEARQSSGRPGLKSMLATALAPLARTARVLGEQWARLWSFARLREALDGRLDASNVVLGPVELRGTRRVSFGRNALVYPGVYLETQGEGCIEIGDGVVLSRGVHIVAYERIVLADGCMVGEYSSLRDANHRTSQESVRDSGHDSSPIELGRNVWIGRGVSVLKGARIGRNSIVGANAVVSRPLADNSRAAGVPARAL